MLQPRQSCTDVILLAVSEVVLSLAQAGASEVEAQDGNPKLGERLHRVVDDLVVQRTASGRMRMTDERGVGRIGKPGIEHGFETSGRAAEVFGGADLRAEGLVDGV